MTQKQTFARYPGYVQFALVVDPVSRPGWDILDIIVGDAVERHHEAPDRGGHPRRNPGHHEVDGSLSRLEHKENCRTEGDVELLPACDCGADAANVAIQREVDLSVESDMMGYAPVDVKARIKAIEDRFHKSYIDDFTRKLIQP